MAHNYSRLLLVIKDAKHDYSPGLGDGEEGEEEEEKPNTEDEK